MWATERGDLGKVWPDCRQHEGQNRKMSEGPELGGVDEKRTSGLLCRSCKNGDLTGFLALKDFNRDGSWSSIAKPKTKISEGEETLALGH